MLQPFFIRHLNILYTQIIRHAMWSDCPRWILVSRLRRRNPLCHFLIHNDSWLWLFYYYHHYLRIKIVWAVCITGLEYYIWSKGRTSISDDVWIWQGNMRSRQRFVNNYSDGSTIKILPPTPAKNEFVLVRQVKNKTGKKSRTGHELKASK